MKPSSSLRLRLLLLTLLPSALIAIVLVAYYTLTSMQMLEGELRNKGLSTVRYMAPISEYGIISGQFESLHGLVHATVQEPGIKAAIIVNAKGRIIAVSGRVSLPSDTLRHPLEEPGEVANQNDWIAFGAPVTRVVSEMDTLFDSAPPGEVTKASETIGHVFVEIDKAVLFDRQYKEILRGTLIALTGLIGLALLAVSLADNLAQPVKRLVDAVGVMSAGQFDVRVPHESDGELGVLEEGFNRMAANLEDIHRSLQTRVEEATAQLAYQARHDALTGLLNRREFELSLEKALATVVAGGTPSSVLFIDLDRFKPVNDACGHLAGDEVLRQMSRLFQGRLREGDTLARLGGDEFGVILHNCSGEHARTVAEDICDLASAYRFIWQDKVFSIGTSIGLTHITPGIRQINELLAAGDAGCHQAKAAGRNQVCEITPTSPLERRRDNREWTQRIASALAENWLQIEAIPIHALRQDHIGPYVVELSARLNEPGRPPITLPALIDAAERCELATLIDLRLIEAAIVTLARARQHGKSLCCLVPMSGMALSHSELPDHIGSLLTREQVPGTGLCLLFGENAVTSESSQARELGQRLSQLGCQLALGEFGSGISSFGLLRQLGPACVKLSPSLTRNLVHDHSSGVVLSAVRAITADQHILSIAEQVDDTAIIEPLRSAGIDYIQGRAVAPCEPLDAWLEGAVIRRG